MTAKGPIETSIPMRAFTKPQRGDELPWNVDWGMEELEGTGKVEVRILDYDASEMSRKLSRVADDHSRRECGRAGNFV
jgi:hypothetical protein